MSHWPTEQASTPSASALAHPEVAASQVKDCLLDSHQLPYGCDGLSSRSSLGLHWPSFDLQGDTSGSSSHSHDRRSLESQEPWKSRQSLDITLPAHHIHPTHSDTSLHSALNRRPKIQTHLLARNASSTSVPRSAGGNSRLSSSSVSGSHSSSALSATRSGGLPTADVDSSDATPGTSSVAPRSPRLRLETLAFQEGGSMAPTPADSSFSGPLSASISSIASSAPDLDSSPETDDGGSDYVSGLRANSPYGSRRSLRHSAATSSGATGSSASSARMSRERELLDLRRTRHKCTSEQLLQLQAFFETNRNPKGKVREELANRLGMPERSVQIWFQNKRAKTKVSDDVISEDKLVVPKASRSSLSSRSDRSFGEGSSRRGSKSFKSGSDGSRTLTQLPAYSLCIGSWRRIAPLTCFYSRRLRTLSWTLKADSVGFKIDIPATSIKYLTFNGPVTPSMSELAEGMHQRLGLLKIELEKPPQFFMETFRSAEPLGDSEAPKNLWRQCDDFTERQEGTNCSSHVLTGPFELLRAAVISLREADPMMRERLGLYDSVTTGMDPHASMSGGSTLAANQQHSSHEPGPPPPLLRQYGWSHTPSFASDRLHEGREDLDTAESSGNASLHSGSHHISPASNLQYVYHHYPTTDANWPYAQSQVSPSLSYAGVGASSSSATSINSFADVSSRNSLGISLQDVGRREDTSVDMKGSPGHDAIYEGNQQAMHDWSVSPHPLITGRGVGAGGGPWLLSDAAAEHNAHEHDYQGHTASYIHDGGNRQHGYSGTPWLSGPFNSTEPGLSAAYQHSTSAVTPLNLWPVDAGAQTSGTSAMGLGPGATNEDQLGEATQADRGHEVGRITAEAGLPIVPNATAMIAPSGAPAPPTSDALFLAMQADDQPVALAHMRQPAVASLAQPRSKCSVTPQLASPAVTGVDTSMRMPAVPMLLDNEGMPAPLEAVPASVTDVQATLVPAGPTAAQPSPSALESL
ncbi:unnamed protein product [Parajaminaea phylloscopi]